MKWQEKLAKAKQTVKANPKRSIVAGGILLAAGIGIAAVTSNPAKYGLMVSNNGSGNAGTWVALTGTGGTPYSGSVTPAGMMVSSDGSGNPGTWVPATPSTFSSAVGGASSSPGIVASVANGTYTNTGGGNVLAYNAPAPGGFYRACGYYMVTAASTTGGNSYLQLTYTSNGHNNTYRLSNNLATTSAGGDSFSTNGYSPCNVVWADPGTTLNIYLLCSGVTAGTPTFVYTATIERLI